MNSIPGYDAWKLASPYDEPCICPRCEERRLQDEMIEVDDSYEWVCESCFEDYVECDHCSSLHLKDDCHEVGDEVVCESCFQEEYIECNKCGEAFNKEDSEHVAEEDLDVPNFYCKKCSHGDQKD